MSHFFFRLIKYENMSLLLSWINNFCLKCKSSAYENIIIPSVTENVIMEVPQQISIYMISVALAYNWIPGVAGAVL